MQTLFEKQPVADAVDYSIIELSGDALLRTALKSSSPSQTLYLAMEAAAAYSMVAEALAGQYLNGEGRLSGKLNVARRVEESTVRYLLEKGTDAAIVQYALANQGRSDTIAHLGRIRSARQAGDTTVSSLVDLELPPERGHDTAVIATLSQVVQGNVQGLNRYAGMAQQYGNLSIEDYRDYLRLLKETDNDLSAILPLHAWLEKEEPTAAAKVNALLGTRLEALVQLQGQITTALAKT